MSNELKEEFRRVLTINRAINKINEIENENEDVIREYKYLLALYCRNEVSEVEFDAVHVKYMAFRENVRNYENMIISYTLELFDETDGELGLFIKLNVVQRQKFIKGVRAIFKEIETKNEVNIKELFEEVVNSPKKQLNNE